MSPSNIDDPSGGQGGAAGTLAGAATGLSAVIDRCQGATAVAFYISATNNKQLASVAITGRNDTASAFVADPDLKIKDKASGVALNASPRPVIVWGYEGTSPIPWKQLQLSVVAGGTSPTDDITGFQIVAQIIDPVVR